jgi:hypothetical protein
MTTSTTPEPTHESIRERLDAEINHLTGEVSVERDPDRAMSLSRTLNQLRDDRDALAFDATAWDRLRSRYFPPTSNAPSNEQQTETPGEQTADRSAQASSQREQAEPPRDDHDRSVTGGQLRRNGLGEVFGTR